MRATQQDGACATGTPVIVGATAKRLAMIAGLFLLAAPPAQGEKRVALVIGNSAYQATAALPNPTNDANDIAGALQRVGFTVQVERDLTKRGMEGALARFARLAEDADAAMFFYAGHGIQYRGTNYLMPIDARIEDEYSINFELLRIDDVLYSMERTRGVKLLVLDACRNNPLFDRLLSKGATRDAGIARGLARIDPTRGMIIAYATQANQVAVDGTGRNSPFTSALVKYLDEPGLEVGAMFRRVAIDVDRATGGRQLPELWVTLRGEFYLNNHETDLQAWARIRTSDDPGQVDEFIRTYPNSLIMPEARQRLAAIARAHVEQAERLVREQATREQAERTERERLAREQAAREQAAREQAERERVAQEQAERAHREQERAALEQVARVERERQERERFAREEAERERAERERLAVEQARRHQVGQEKAVSPGGPQIVMVTPPAEPTPKAPSMSSLALVKEIKSQLKRVGCLAGSVDGKWASADTYTSIAKYARFTKLDVLPEHPTPEFLDALKRSLARVCPLECGVRQVEKDGACIAKVCPAGQQLRPDGQCIHNAKPKPTRREAAKPRGGGGRRCFVLGGSSFCE
jgi:hypothetical protein